MRKLTFTVAMLLVTGLSLLSGTTYAQEAGQASVGPAPGTMAGEEVYTPPAEKVLITQQEFMMASPSKQKLILAHPEAYEIVNSRPQAEAKGHIENQKQVQQPVSGIEPGHEPVITEVPRSVYEAASVERKAYMDAHPDNYIIVDDPVTEAVEAAPAETPRSIVKVQVTKKELRKTSKEKREYILSHPDEFEIIK